MFPNPNGSLNVNIIRVIYWYFSIENSDVISLGTIRRTYLKVLSNFNRYNLCQLTERFTEIRCDYLFSPLVSWPKSRKHVVGENDENVFDNEFQRKEDGRRCVERFLSVLSVSTPVHLTQRRLWRDWCRT